MNSPDDTLEAIMKRPKVRTVEAAVTRLERIDQANWSISRARDAGWVNSRLLWEIRTLTPLRAAFVRNLDRTVGFAGRGLLVPRG